MAICRTVFLCPDCGSCYRVGGYFPDVNARLPITRQCGTCRIKENIRRAKLDKLEKEEGLKVRLFIAYGYWSDVIGSHTGVL